MKKINITFCSFPDYAGNAKALYEYMVRRYKNNMNYTWIVYENQNQERLKKIGVNAILIGSEEFKKYISKTNVFFTTQGNLDGDKIKTKNAIYIELWHGIGPKPIGFTQEKPTKDDIEGYSNISEIVDYFIVPSDFWKVVYGAIFKTEADRIKSFGMPLLDYFNNSNGKVNLSKILNKDVEKYEKIIMYMPTFKKGFNHNDIETISKNIFNFRKEYDEEKLDRFLKKNNYLLCVKKHPGEQAKLKFNDTNNIININEEMLSCNNLSVNEIINAFDLLITDYSSIGTEFIYLDRPVLFAVGDYDEYRKNRGILFGNLDFWTPGPICQDIKQLTNELFKLLNDSTYYLDERIKYKKLWFNDIKDGGCDKICDFLFDDYQISKNVSSRKSLFSKYKLENEKYKGIIDEQIITIKKLTESDMELKLIKNSKGWKMLEKLRKLVKRSK